MQKHKIVLLIPSFRPPEDFPVLTERFLNLGLTDILVVNDGSPAEYDPIFEKVSQQNVTVIRSKVNEGKGAALKKGYQHLLTNRKDFEYVTACDDDGQHLPEDVEELVATINNDYKVYFGTRSFTGRVPIKSRIGNLFMSVIFFTIAKRWIQDTQTGLRCYHRDLLPKLMATPSSGFNFESISLLTILSSGEIIRQHPIRTVYFNSNKGTRFRLFSDSYRIVFDLLRFRLLRNHVQ